MRSLRRFLRRTVKFFVSFQVELRGHYSVNRIRNFDEYRRTTSTLRALFICFILPFPCLAVLSMVDAAPLAPPSSSSKDNYMFWIRDCILVVLLTRAIMEQISINVPGLHMSTMQRLIPSVAATLTATAYRMMCSSLIGFPLPFQLVFGIPVWLTTLVICFVVFFGQILKRDRVLLWDLIMAIVVLQCQILLTFVYPIYFYGFQSVGVSGQRYYVMLLPIIKILAKNLISGTLGSKYDLLPQIMIFNVDVFNALYVSSSMQTSNSITTTFGIMVLDAVQALISISDIGGFMRHIILLQRKIPDSHPMKSACFVDIALQILQEDDQARSHLDTCRYSSAVAVLRRKLSSENSFIFRRPSDPAKYIKRTMPPSARSVSVMVTPADHSVPAKQEDPHDPRSLLINVFSSKERKIFVHKTAQVLFTTEFVMLVEYTEAIVPLIYCIYTVSMFFLPNRIYYPQLKSLDEAGLEQKIGSVLTYVTLEFLSLLVIGHVIQRKLRISMLRLISFVLDKGWRMVQANLCLWIFFTVESSLEHSGNDYSFSFSWLKGNS